MSPIIIEDNDAPADGSDGDMIHSGHAQLSTIREEDGEGHERRRVNQLADVFFHRARSYAVRVRKAMVTMVPRGNVDIPQKAFIEVLKA